MTIFNAHFGGRLHCFSKPSLYWLWFCAGLAGASQVGAATLTWGGLGSSGNWSDSANWGSAGTPGSGDVLIFPAGAPRLSNTNNLLALALAEIRFTGASGGFAIYGNAFSLTNGIQATNTSGANTISADISMISGTVTVNVGSGVTLNSAGAIGGSAALVKSGGGTLAFIGSAANTYTNGTTVNQGTLQLSKSITDSSLHGPLIIGDDVGGINADVVRLGGIEQMNDNIPVTIHSSGLLDLAGTSEFFGSLEGMGNLVLGAASPRIGVNNASTIFEGVISGTGTVYKRGTGTLTLKGNNTYPATQIDAGTLIFNGFQPTSSVYVTSGATLGGSGGVGIVTAQGGATVSAGSSAGMLSCSNLVLLPGATNRVELNGNLPGSGFDQLRVQGTNTINGAVLKLSVGQGFAPLEGAPLVILDNDLNDAITGTFTNLPEGSLISLGALKFRISYVGGTGNDITLTLTNAPAKVHTYAVSGGNGNPFVDVNECNDLRLVITNASGAPLTGVTATLASATPGVDIIQRVSSYPDVPAGGIATNLTAFQIMTQPSFACGAPITLILSLATGSGGFAVPFTFTSASSSPAVRFDYNTLTNILDFTTNDLPVVVSGISNSVLKVTVSLYVTHTYDGDLSFFLIAPNGSAVELSSANGGQGANYGSGCALDATRTTFDDAASISISNATAPFVGTYRPESPLSSFKGLSGTNVNGTWKLRAIDGGQFDTGTLNCWSLLINQLNCPSGGGLCPVCANTTIAGVIGGGSAIQVDRLTRSAQPSSCDTPTACPGPIGFGATSFEAFTFQNEGSNSCINVSLSAPNADLFSAAYLGSFDPNDLCLNYLADSGNSTAMSGPVDYSFVVPSNSVFVVTVNSIESSSGPFELSVTGGDCRPALRLNQVGGNQVKVDWPSFAGSYLLESALSLTPTNWTAVSDTPVLSNGRYAVTNNLGTNRFYRLRKPL